MYSGGHYYSEPIFDIRDGVPSRLACVARQWLRKANLCFIVATSWSTGMCR